MIQDISQYFGGLSNSIYEPYKYLPYLSNDSLYYGLLKIDETFWIHKYFKTSNIIFYNFDFYSKLLTELRNTFSQKEELKDGFLPDNSVWSSDFEKFKNENPNGIESSIDENYKVYLRDLKDYCEQNNIVLILTNIKFLRFTSKSTKCLFIKLW